MDSDRDRFWLGGATAEDHGQWVWPQDVEDALDAAQLAITEYHNGDREWATRWLLRALEANKAWYKRLKEKP